MVVKPRLTVFIAVLFMAYMVAFHYAKKYEGDMLTDTGSELTAKP
jgi:preprotein translocase subunit SecG